MSEWLTLDLEQYKGIILSVFLMYLVILGVVRLNGLRSFSKMSGHDFAITVAIGSVLAATVVSETTSVGQGTTAIIALLAFQSLISWLRRGKMGGILENTPLLLMDGPNILHDNLKKAKIKETDLISKLREANVIDLKEVRAVVLEATGDVSVLHGEDKELQDYLLKGVRKK